MCLLNIYPNFGIYGFYRDGCGWFCDFGLCTKGTGLLFAISNFLCLQIITTYLVSIAPAFTICYPSAKPLSFIVEYFDGICNAPDTEFLYFIKCNVSMGGVLSEYKNETKLLVPLIKKIYDVDTFSFLLIFC